ncbi:citramalate synthase [Haliovirga abyssi]|uniref:Citramalate synthase n=1 Tax=Haliovirga abyssi TaxID=2996794 RepID=A0AAU9DXJ4_9FUSO|nr:citramalate synthase [Haliovirga abyssi]BDU51181.1 (R)-citramalate synthase [Haliovirga abyssi]
MGKKIFIYDTTLRDGSQMKGINFSVEDKLRIVKELDKMEIDYIECGWPGSNPKDEEFFKLIKLTKMNHSKIAAFGSTRHPKNRVEDDVNIKKLIEAETDVVTIFGKTWDLHVEKALGITLEENLILIEDSIKYLKENVKEVFFDAEHFFDGYKSNPEYALKVLKAAEKGGADIIVLADTNGGSLYYEIAEIIDEIKKVIKTPFGIHAHNDSGLANANSIEAVRKGGIQIQGTINGYGERCGNANLCEIIPNLMIKMGYDVIGDKLTKITKLSRFVSEISNRSQAENMPYVGGNAFGHKGGIHVSAIMKDTHTYEHIEPEKVGNKRNVLVSDLSGKSNILYKANELGIKLDKNDNVVKEVIKAIKSLENQGYEFEGADGSFELLLKKAMKQRKYFFDLISFRMIIERTELNKMISEATIKLDVDGKETHTVSEGDGPVNALDAALRKALLPHYPQIKDMELVDYKVRVLNGKDGTAAKVRVLIETVDKLTGERWGTVGVSENIIKASWEALIDSVEYYLNN